MTLDRANGALRVGLASARHAGPGADLSVRRGRRPAERAGALRITICALLISATAGLGARPSWAASRQTPIELRPQPSGLRLPAEDAQFEDTTVAHFSAGAAGGCLMANGAGGEVTLTPTLREGFDGDSLPAGWEMEPWDNGGSVVVASGVLTVDGARAYPTALYTVGRTLEFTATFGAQSHQHAGLGLTYAAPPWAMFSTFGTIDTVFARVNGTSQSLGSLVGTAHRYRIEWTASAVRFYVDGALGHEETVTTITDDLRPVFSDLNPGGDALVVADVYLGPHATPCTFQSQVFDASDFANWTSLAWVADLPSATSLAMSYRLGNTALPDADWTGFIPVPTSGTALTGNARYAQYQAVLSTTDPDQAPVLEAVTVSYNLDPDAAAPVILTRSPAPGATGVLVASDIVIGFNEPLDADTVTAPSVTLRRDGAEADTPATLFVSGATVTLDPVPDLFTNSTYQVTVAGSVTDRSGNPIGSAVEWSFTTAAIFGSVNLATATDFNLNADLGTCRVVEGRSGGELQLVPLIEVNFDNSELPSGWEQAEWTGGAATVSGGWLTVDGARANTVASFGPGRALEFVATFGTATFQAGGFGNTLADASQQWAVFGTAASTTVLHARTNPGDDSTDVPLAGTWIGSPHRYRIDWTSAQILFSIDGNLVHTANTSIDDNLRPIVSEFSFDSTSLAVDWLDMSPYASPCTYTSRVFDAGTQVDWDALTYTGATPDATSLAFDTRSGHTPTPDENWSAWQAVNSPIASPDARYLQFRVTLATSDPDQTPALDSVSLTWTEPPTAIRLLNLAATSGRRPAAAGLGLAVILTAGARLVLWQRRRPHSTRSFTHNA